MCIISDQLEKYSSDPNSNEAQKHGNMLMSFVEPMLDFVTWFNNQTFSSSLTTKNAGKLRDTKRGNESASAFFMTLRDILSWVDFLGTTTAPKANRSSKSLVLDPWPAYMHGAALVVLDGLGLGAGLSDRATCNRQEYVI